MIRKHQMHYYLLSTKAVFIFCLVQYGATFLSANALTQDSVVYSSSGFLENNGQVVNQSGQVAREVLFQTNLSGVDVFVTKTGLSYVFKKFEEVEKQTHASNEERYNNGSETEEILIHYHRVDVQLKGAVISEKNIKKEMPVLGYGNYYLGHCADGILNVKSYQKVVIKEIYSGIDWVLRSDENGGLKYDFVVHPGADPKQIQLYYEGGEDFVLNKKGNSLSIATDLGEVFEGALYCYTKENKQHIAGHFDVRESTVSISLESYPQNETLIIDPPLQLGWATCYGNGSFTGSKAMATDENGQLYVTGYVLSSTFPTLDPGGAAYFQGTYGGARDALILKFNQEGQRLWATYYGGSLGERANALAISQANHIYITGYTSSLDFPTLDPGGNAYFQGVNEGIEDIFILKFNEQGQRLWATYYGGNGSDFGHALAVDHNHNLYVTGHSRSNNLPTQDPGGGAYFQGMNEGYSDIFILKFNAQGQRLWATYYGGNLGDQGSALAIDSNANIYLSGETSSLNFPNLNPGGSSYFQANCAGDEDAFIAKFNTEGQCLWATYYGGSSKERTKSMAISTANDIYITGYTDSPNLPTLDPGGGAYYQNFNAGNDDIFVLKFNGQGQRLWATYLGGTGIDWASAIAVDENRSLYVTGGSYSNDFPILNYSGGNYFQEVNQGDEDVFILKFNESDQQLWGTYYGGESRDWGTAIACADTCVFFSGEVTDDTTPFTLDPGNGAYYQSTINGEDNVFILQFCGCLEPTVNILADTSICTGDSVLIVASGGESYLWENGATDSSLVLFPSQTDFISVEVFKGGCSTIDSIEIEVELPASLQLIATDSSLCFGDTTQLTADGAGIYLWQTGETSASIEVSPLSSQFYAVVASNGSCNTVDSIEIVVNPNPVADIMGDTVLCLGDSITLTASGGLGYLWNTGQDTPVIVISPSATTTYQVEVFDAHCTAEDATQVQVLPVPLLSIYGDTLICEGDSTILVASGGDAYLWQGGNTDSSVVVSPLSTQHYSVQASLGICSIQDSVQVLVHPRPFAEIIGDSLLCEGDSIVLIAVGGMSYLWNTQDTSSQITVAPFLNTQYAVTAFDEYCNSKDSLLVEVIENPRVEIVGDSMLCEGDSATLFATGAYTYTWGNGSTASSVVANPQNDTLIYLQGFLGSCSAEDSFLIQVLDNPTVIIDGDTSLCNGEYAVLLATGALNYLWVGEDSSSFIEANPSSDQSYWVTGYLENCQGRDTLSIFVHESPVANFSFSPSPPQVNTPVYFRDASSTDATSWHWDFGTDDFSVLQYPEYTYDASGVYEVSLVVSNTFGCVDSVVKSVIVEQEFTLFIPNAFTPDGDGINDVFHIQGTGLDELEFELKIFNRWGEEIFQITDLQEGWAGVLNNSQSRAPQGVYPWKLQYYTNDNALKVQFGQLTLLR